uniref:Ribonuclease A-domain domain-containing protein n=1 Tax=Naja naja TaxID=35670 RepID=A0A8C6XD93_NAJNA
KDTIQYFQRKHIDSITPDLPINPDLYCDNMMRYRQMIYPLCKSHNTFLLAPVQTVQQVCQTISRQTKILSRVTFTFVFCVDTGSIHPPNCNYHGYIMSGRIRVTCKNYVPIHFNGFI